MLARRILPEEFERWNHKWHAPFGCRRRLFKWIRGTKFGTRQQGPFAWQSNNSTREFEYPWAHKAISSLGSGKTIVEIGGGLSGLQFVLGAEGNRIINVDPGLAAAGKGWAVDQQVHARLQECFNARVELYECTIQNSNLPDEFADVVYCISALEHFSTEDLDAVATHGHRILKRGGHAVFTIDLFLDTEPFCSSKKNRYGRNIDVYRFLESAKLTLVEGVREELNGFPEFTCDGVLSRLSDLHVGIGYPCLAQCLVARKS